MENVVRALMLAATLLAATAAGAQTVYKSTNPDGSIVYSDKPPADGKIDKVIVFPDLPSSELKPLAVQSLPQRSMSPGTQRQAVMTVAPNGARMVHVALTGSSSPNEVQSSSLTDVKPAPSPPRNMNVTLYSAAWCGYCRRAKAYLAQNGIAYDDIDVDTPDGRAAFEQVGKDGVPLLVSGKKRVRGFRPEGYDAFFTSR
jgi:glutaredoxin